MPRAKNVKFRAITAVQKYIANPVAKRLPTQVLLETTGRTSGLPRATPIGGKRVGHQFWLVSEHGERSQYIRNIKADPRVRLRLRGQWHSGTAHLLPDADPRARLKTMRGPNSAAVLATATDLLSVRVDLDA